MQSRIYLSFGLCLPATTITKYYYCLVVITLLYGEWCRKTLRGLLTKASVVGKRRRPDAVLDQFYKHRIGQFLNRLYSAG